MYGQSCSWTPQESEVEGYEDQDNANIHGQPFPESVSEEREIYTDDNGYHRHHVNHLSYLSAHFSLLLEWDALAESVKEFAPARPTMLRCVGRWALLADGATLSVIVLNKIVNHPVWSNAIGTVLAAAFIAVVAWITHRLKPGWMMQKITGVWAYFLSPRPISHWLFGLLVFVSALMVLVIVLVVGLVRFRIILPFDI